MDIEFLEIVKENIGSREDYRNYQNPESITEGDTIKGWIIDKEIPVFKGEDREYIDKLIFVGEV